MNDDTAEVKSVLNRLDGKTGRKINYIYERLYIVFDDLFAGISDNENVNLTYADGFKESEKTDGDGEILVSSSHGNYVDVEVNAELDTYMQRVFIMLDDYRTRNGAWQRLINLGYVHESSPQNSPENDVKLEAALQAFQAEFGISTNGSVEDVNALKKLQMEHDEEATVWCERNSSAALDISKPISADYSRSKIT